MSLLLVFQFLRGTAVLYRELYAQQPRSDGITNIRSEDALGVPDLTLGFAARFVRDKSHGPVCEANHRFFRSEPSRESRFHARRVTSLSLSHEAATGLTIRRS